MTEKVKQYEQACMGKSKIPTFAIARNRARILSNRYDSAFSVYVCAFCHRFHVGSSDDETQERRRGTMPYQRERRVDEDFDLTEYDYDIEEDEEREMEVDDDD